MLVIGTVGCGGVNYTPEVIRDASRCWPGGRVGVGFQFAGTATRVSAAVEPFDGRMGVSINELCSDVESPGLGPLRTASAGWVTRPTDASQARSRVAQFLSECHPWADLASRHRQMREISPRGLDQPNPGEVPVRAMRSRTLFGSPQDRWCCFRRTSRRALCENASPRLETQSSTKRRVSITIQSSLPKRKSIAPSDYQLLGQERCAGYSPINAGIPQSTWLLCRHIGLWPTGSRNRRFSREIHPGGQPPSIA